MDQEAEKLKLNRWPLNLIPGCAPMPMNLPARPNRIIFVTSLFANVRIEFRDVNPLEGEQPYDIEQGSIRFLTVREDVPDGTYYYDVTCEDEMMSYRGVEFPDVEQEEEEEENDTEQSSMYLVAGPSIIIKA